MISSRLHVKDLKSILLDENTKNLFQKNYLPTFDDMGNGEIYFHTNKFVYSKIGSHYQKFLMFDKDGNLLTDVKYNYTLFVPDGYLMKITIPSPSQIMNFDIEYFIKMDDINVISNYEKIKSSQPNLDTNEIIIFSSIDYRSVLKDPMKTDLGNSADFFNKYLNYDIK